MKRRKHADERPKRRARKNYGSAARPVWIGNLDKRREAFYAMLERVERRESVPDEPVLEIGYGGVPPITGKASDWGAKIAHNQTVRLHPLDILLRNKDLDPSHWYAGVRFRADYELAQISPANPVSWDRIEALVMKADPFKRKTGFGVRRAKVRVAWRDFSVFVLDAKQALEDVQESVSKMSFALLVSICGQGHTIADTARSLGKQRPYISQRFREALEEAGDYYSQRIGD